MLLSFALGGVAELMSPKARAIGHATFWGVNFGLFVCLSMYYWKRTAVARKGMELQWAPFTITVLGACLIMVDLTRHVLLDLDLAGAELAMYTDEEGAFMDLSTVGLVGFICTWVGWGLLSIGIAWFVDLPGKAAAALASLSAALAKEPSV